MLEAGVRRSLERNRCRVVPVASRLTPYASRLSFSMAGLPALQGSESGQVRKEAATAITCKCRGLGSPPLSVRRGGRSGSAPSQSVDSRMSQPDSAASGQALARKWRPRSFDRDGRARARGASPDQCAEAEALASRLSDDRHPRGGQDHARARHGQGAELRDRGQRFSPAAAARPASRSMAGASSI